MDDEDASNSGTGSWKALLHVAWDVIFDRLLPPSGSGHVPQGSFSEFFRIVVDGKHIYVFVSVTATPHTLDRVLVLPFILCREKILGIPSVQKSSSTGWTNRAPYALHQKSHAELDQPSFKQGSLSAQNFARCGMFHGSPARPGSLTCGRRSISKRLSKPLPRLDFH